MKRLVWLTSRDHHHNQAFEALADEKWEIVLTSDVTVLEREVRWNGISLAILEGNLNSSEAKKLETFFKRYNTFPVFNFQRPKTVNKSTPWSYWYNKNFEKQSFIEAVERFAVYAESERARRQGELLMDKMEKLADCFDVRDMNMTLINALNFFQKEFQCENVYWFKSGELANAIEKAKKNEPHQFVSLEDMKFSTCPMMASRPFIIDTLPDLFLQTEAHLPKKWEDRSEFYEFNGEEFRFLFVPVLSGDVGEVIGHFLLVNGVGVQGTWLASAIERVQRLIGRNLTFGLQFEVVKSLSYMDHLTQLFNHRYLPMVLDREINRVERYNSKFSVLFLDIDYFKSVNDNHGHLTGSEILTQLGDVLRACIRESDYGFRFGGDEFVLVLVETGVEQAKNVAERIREKIEKQVFKLPTGEYRITVSIGIATCPVHARTKEEILALADEAMYYGKNTTKNVVYVAS